MKLTDKQQAILNFINEHSYVAYPTIREIASAFHVYPATIQDHIKALRRKGYLAEKRRTKKQDCV